MENPIKMDDLGVPLFSETSIYRYIFCDHILTHLHQRGRSHCRQATNGRKALEESCCLIPFPTFTLDIPFLCSLAGWMEENPSSDQIGDGFLGQANWVRSFDQFLDHSANSKNGREMMERYLLGQVAYGRRLIPVFSSAKTHLVRWSCRRAWGFYAENRKCGAFSPLKFDVAAKPLKKEGLEEQPCLLGR